MRIGSCEGERGGGAQGVGPALHRRGRDQGRQGGAVRGLWICGRGGRPQGGRGHPLPDRQLLQGLYRGGGRGAGGPGQARLGQARDRIPALDSVHGPLHHLPRHDARPALPPHGPAAARRLLDRRPLHPPRHGRKPTQHAARLVLPLELVLSEHLLCGGGHAHRGAFRTDLGGVCAREPARAHRHDAHHLLCGRHRRRSQPRRAL